MRGRGSGMQRATSALSAAPALTAWSALTAVVSLTAWSALSAVAALTVLSALSAPAAAGAGALDGSPLYALPGNYCDRLQKELDGGPERRDAIQTLVLEGGGAAARAAHALLRALLLRGVRVPEDKVALRRAARGDALCPFLHDMRNVTKDWGSGEVVNQELPLTLAAAWRGEPCTTWSNPESSNAWFHEGISGFHMGVHAGRAPAARRLLARRAAAAAATCAAWDDLLSPACLFLAPRDARLHGELTTPPSDWPNCTCSASNTMCIPVLVAVDPQDAGATARLAGELCARAAAAAPHTPLRLAPLNDSSLRRALRHHDRSFLFVDYDWWDSSVAERVQLAPPFCSNRTDACTRLVYDYAIPMFVAPVKQIKFHMPFALGVLANFRPSHATLRRVLRNEPELQLEEAACEALLHVPHQQVRDWINCPEKDLIVYVQTCGEAFKSKDIENNITDIVFKHWKPNPTIKIKLNFAEVIQCNDSASPNSNFTSWMKKWDFGLLLGVVVMGDGGAGLLPKTLADLSIPLLLGEAPEDSESPSQGAGSRVADACAVSPSGARLLAALRWLLARCGWARAAVLRDEGRGAKWQNFSAAVGNESALVLHQQILGPGGAAAALAALRARRARVVVVDAGAARAADALAQAERDGMTPAAGYAWLVLRAAGERADWRPGSAAFEYVTLSGWWRGGAGAGGGAAPGGVPALRAALEDPRLPPMTAPLVDALLMMLTGMEHLLDKKPLARYNHTEEYRLFLLESLKNQSVSGVAQEHRCGVAPVVFVHRWRVSGAQLLATWPPGAGNASAALCERVRDAARCHTTSSGDAYSPTCHDVAWTVCLCALVLAPPALCAAAAARRARLRRRDRAVEQRLLARAGRSEAAAAALAEHAVPRAALELMDELGVGHYGSVRLAVLRAPDSAPLAVAAKTPRADAAAEAKSELLREAALLATLRHDHVVRFAGVCFEGAPLVLMEHAFHGDLRRYLRARRPMLERARAGLPEPEAEHVEAAALTRLAREAAAALGYLAINRLVHRDVRAANCLVDARRSLKLADFGLARRLDEVGGASAGEYLCRRRALFPVLWMAPESLERGVFSPATDVWGLGVLMLELATLGARPFGAWPAPRVLSHVRAGGAPPLPRDAAASTRGVAATCWRRAAAERPSAAELVAYLAMHPRALRPALAPLEGDAGAAPAPDNPDKNFYCEEWTT